MRKSVISIIVPTYNSEGFLEKNIKIIISTAKKLKTPFEIIIAEDGCSDRTPKIAEKLSKKYSCVFHQHYKEKLGRGRALKKAFMRAKGNIIVYMDDDLATDLVHLPELMHPVLDDGFDVVTGSRLMVGSKVIGRPAKREIASRAFNFFVRLLLHSRLYDHQCGFKAFKKNTVKPILPAVKDSHWFFDTEILVRAQRRNLRVKEIPVIWQDDLRESTVHFLKDAKNMGMKIFRLWFEFSFSHK
ncbi:MAG: glycosyltransferase family 2 protein [Candidatus Aenigmarchaeota archaeon]|nr:glycosyltransferase family 2 protein [Candidatus Aenigmarchaeota archaeon]MCK5333064.1 glycosyltransferase family 2 protein [Candidatus Aenigmarchaeota archaeon]